MPWKRLGLECGGFRKAGIVHYKDCTDEIMQAITAPFKRSKPSSLSDEDGLDNSIEEGIKYHL